MNRLERIQGDLQQVSAAIVRAERNVARFPNRPSTVETLRSMHKQREDLEEQFEAVAAEVGLDLCSYRVEYEDKKSATITSITTALNSFQKLFTQVYDAIVSGPKKRATVAAEIIEQTSFGFAYTFPGSIGFMMTLANEQQLFDQSQLDHAMDKTLDLLKAQSVGQIEQMAAVVGLAAVRLAHTWAVENAKARLGADIVWQRRSKNPIAARIQPQQIATLANAIGQAIAKETVVKDGELVHVDVIEKTFEMQVDDIRIKGAFDKAISAQRPVRLPAYYRSTLTVNTKVAVADGEEDTSYFLVSLEPAPVAP